MSDYHFVKKDSVPWSQSDMMSFSYIRHIRWWF